MRFLTSSSLSHLRLQRRSCEDSAQRKQLSFQMQRQQRREVRSSHLLNRMLADPKSWHFLSVAKFSPFGWKTQQHPQHEEFAMLLEELYAGNPTKPTSMPTLTEQPFSAAELDDAVHCLKRGKASDEYGLVAELSHHVSTMFLDCLQRSTTSYALEISQIPGGCCPN